MEDTIKAALIDIVRRANFTDQLIDLVSYAYDASDHDHRPEAAVWPTSAEQVSRILGLANKLRLPVTPRGAGTGLAGSAIPEAGGLVLDMCRMNEIVDIRIADRLAIVQPGVVYADLERALERFGFFFPPDPASASVCTLGGNVATNAGGIRGAKYGVTGDYVLGLEVVLPDGRIMHTGSDCMKSVSGYDITQLFVGSEGTLGVITEITLKINPRPIAVKTLLASFASLEDASRAIIDVMHSGIIPSVLELLDENSISVLREHGNIELPDVSALILVETDGYTEAETSHQMTMVSEVFKKQNVTDLEVANTAEEVEELWRARRSVGSTAALLRPSSVSEDVTVPISKIPDLLRGISTIVRNHNLPFVIFGHAGDGNFHPRIMYDPSDPGQVSRVRKTVDQIFRLTCELGGTLSGEHGIGLSKAPYMSLEHDPVEVGVMRSIKKLFDPNNILNPGKMALEI